MALLPINEIAERYGKTVSQVRYAIDQGRIPCTKVGWSWVVNDEDLPDKWPMTPREKIKHDRRIRKVE